jgi:hypothetical protein
LLTIYRHIALVVLPVCALVMILVPLFQWRLYPLWGRIVSIATGILLISGWILLILAHRTGG